MRAGLRGMTVQAAWPRSGPKARLETLTQQDYGTPYMPPSWTVRRGGRLDRARPRVVSLAARGRGRATDGIGVRRAGTRDAAGAHADVCVDVDSRFHKLRARPAGCIIERQGHEAWDAHPACSIFTR